MAYTHKTLTLNDKDLSLILCPNVRFSAVDSYFHKITRDLTMDIIYPDISQYPNESHPASRYPCIVFFVGGAFVQACKELREPFLMQLARRGFVVVSAEYRLRNNNSYAEPEFPCMVEDAKAAVRFLRAHAAHYMIDPEHIGVFGDSAGAYVAAMAACTNGEKEFDVGEYLDYSSDVQSCALFYPVSVVNCPEGKLRMLCSDEVFGGYPYDDPALDKVVSPIHHIKADTPPFLIFNGTADSWAEPVHAELFCEALDRHKVEVTLYTLQDATHSGPLYFQDEIADLIADFFHRHLG